MRILTSELRTKAATSDAPGSRRYIESVDGTITVLLSPAELEHLEVGEDSPDFPSAVRELFSDSPECVQHRLGGVTVAGWTVEKVEGARITLSVRDFDAEAPELEPEENYDWAWSSSRSGS